MSIDGVVRENSFQEILEGPQAFYNQSDYLERARRDFAQVGLLPVSYTWNTGSKVERVALSRWYVITGVAVAVSLTIARFSKVFALGFLVISLYPVILLVVLQRIFKGMRAKIPLEGEWKYKRITVEVDGNKIDAVIVGRASTLNNGRWVLTAFYESRLSSDRSFLDFLSKVQGNAIIFDHSGVGASSGLPGTESAAKVHRAMLVFLEDRRQGIGAREIIGYGYCDFIQADALKTHELKKDVKYVFVQNGTFSHWHLFLGPIVNKIRQFFMPSGDPADSSKQLRASEVILQAADVEKYEELKESSKIRGRAPLAKALLDDDACPKHNKVFIGVPDQRDVELQNPAFLAQKINALLEKQGVSDGKK